MVSNFRAMFLCTNLKVLKKYDNVLSMVSLAIFFMYMELWYLKTRKIICTYSE